MNHSTKKVVKRMDGTSNYYGIFCDSGHKAALGIQLHMTNVWMESRPTPDEFKEVLRKAREMLAKRRAVGQHSGRNVPE